MLLVVGLALGGAAGAWIAHRAAFSDRGSATPSAAPAEGESEQLYTCGMHPNVIQRGPGLCPICHMKLTPLKQAPEPADSSRPAGPEERRVLYWQSPMHPEFVSDRPGKDSMGMDLVPVYAEQAGRTVGPKITIDPVTVQNMGIRTTTVRRGPLVKAIRTVGRVEYDEQTVRYVDTKFEGWIQKLYVDETGSRVEKGAPLFDVYSPKLYSAQEELLAALRGVQRLSESALPEAREQASRLVEAARVQLRYFDVSDDQIDQLQRSGEIQKTLTIHSPARGIVTEKMALEGMYVQPGMRLYTIADLDKVWVLLDIYEYQLPWVRIAQKAIMTLPYIPGRQFAGQVVYIYPYLQQQTRVVKVRLEFENPALELKPDMYANVTLQADLDRQALLIPREAYIDSGTRKVSFVDLDGGKFEPREVQVGVEAEDGMVEVLSGLEVGERVVVSGQFMLDAESKLREAIAKMLEAERPGPPVVQPAAGTQPARAADIPPGARYVCPMHPEQVRSDQPGTCPICGMRLVAEEALPRPTSPPAAIAVQMNFLMEHYLELQKRFASDRTAEVPLHALGLVAAADEVLKHLEQPGVDLPPAFGQAARDLRAAAVKTTGQDLDKDRVTFVALSAAMRTLVEQVRPDRSAYPKIYIFHCPMTKGDWLQATEDLANPFYGFKMLKCGELRATR
jgi:Cu(I)/Ag(I) efflux system membrane fusion protein/cobalt-zinc-cadmium efflux system membrane fusion protein